ncbi:MAG: hypothetical protein ACJ8F1_22170 [Polyangia bacterium]
MDAGQVARYARQIALPEIGPDGQAAICGARVLIVGSDLAAEIARTYLTAAGVGAVETLARPAGDGAAWLDALAGIDLVVRTDFDDDAMLGAAARLGVPVVVARAEPDRVDLLAFPRRPGDPSAEIDVRARAAARRPDGATGVLAGALAAAEALATLVRDENTSAARGKRHLRLPVDGGDAIAQDIGGRP